MSLIKASFLLFFDRLTSLYILGLYENNSVDLMPYLFSVDYFAVSYYSWPFFLHSYLLQLTALFLSALWFAIHMIGIGVSWLAARWLWALVAAVKVPVKTAFQTAHGLGFFGVYVMFIGLFLFAPLSMIILAFRLLEKCWNDSLNRIVRLTRLSQIFRFILLRLPFVLSRWIRDESIGIREFSVATASVVAMLNSL